MCTDLVYVLQDEKLRRTIFMYELRWKDEGVN